MQTERAALDVQQARDTAMHLPRRLLAPRAQHAADPTPPRDTVCSNERTSAPGTRAGGGAPCRRSARVSADRSPVGAAERRSTHRFADPQPAHAAHCAMQRPARRLPVQVEKNCLARRTPAPPLFRASMRTAKKSRGRRPSRGRLLAPLAPTVAHTYLQKCQKGAMECMQGARSGDARTAFPGQNAPRGLAHVNTMLVALLVVLVPSAEAADFPWLGSYVARWLGHFYFAS